MKLKEIKGIVCVCALAAALAIVPLAGCSSKAADDAGADTPGVDQAYTLYLGTNDKDTNEPVYTPEESMERAKAILMENFGGYTIQEAQGGWKGDDGTEYQEYTLVIYLSDTDSESVHSVAKELIEEFNQSSILINTESVETEFYSGE